MPVLAKQQTEEKIPTTGEIIARARAMIPTLAKRAPLGERERTLPKETIAEMQAAGLFRVLQPKRWGGYEMEAGTFYDIEIALGEGDMSIGWTYGVLGAVTWFLGLIDDRAAQEVWGHDPTTLICTSRPARRSEASCPSRKTVRAKPPAKSGTVLATVALWTPGTAAARSSTRCWNWRPRSSV